MRELVLTLLLTYNHDARPIFEKHCIQCHNAGPLNWMSYDNAYKFRESIKFRVWDTRNMPSSGYMTEEERKVIKDWVDQGAKE